MSAARTNRTLETVQLFLRRIVAPFRASSTRLALPLILVFGLAATAVFAWSKWGPQISAGSQYQIRADRLSVTEKPAWIQADVKREVIRDGSLDHLSVLDRDVTVRIARAFELHAWVQRVRRVSKGAGGWVEVDVVYRQPCLMVETDGGFWPVDSEGVLLPPQEFTPEQTRQYLRLSTSHTVPTGPVGTPFGGLEVQGAAELATLLQGHWQKLGLHRIVADANTEGVRGAAPTYSLLTRTGKRYEWGHAPGREVPGEPEAPQKLTKLRQSIEGTSSAPAERAAALDLSR